MSLLRKKPKHIQTLLGGGEGQDVPQHVGVFFMVRLDSASKCSKNKLTGLYKGLCEGEQGDVENRQENIGLWAVFVLMRIRNHCNAHKCSEM